MVAVAVFVLLKNPVLLLYLVLEVSCQSEFIFFHPSFIYGKQNYKFYLFIYLFFLLILLIMLLEVIFQQVN